MSQYNHKDIEKKWQERWTKNDIYATENSSGEKRYVLDMFPYPSGDGLHVGHPKGYIATDIYSRYHRMKGYSVLHPMGWDAFGLPAENYAIKTKIHPKETTKKTIANFKEQIKDLSLSYDWSREINTSDPEYYRWTQWLFLELYKNGLAYKKKAKVNWCEACKTVLANEQAEGGWCERCKGQVEQKYLPQWFFKITDFADDLIKGLKELNWPESTKIAQENWIGRSEGAEIEFPIKGQKETIRVFTTRPDTLYGATYMVLAPEHVLIKKLKPSITNWSYVEKYIKKAISKTELERVAENKDKSGIILNGVVAINPANKEEIPIFVADYVLSGYGTGAIMAVPAHDERDFEFAAKHDLLVTPVIEPLFVKHSGEDGYKENEPTDERNIISAIVRNPKNNKYLVLKWNGVDWTTFITGGVEKGQTPEAAARAEILEETGYKNLKLVNELPAVHSKFFHVPKKSNRYAHFSTFLFELENEDQDKISESEKAKHKAMWVNKDEVEKLNLPESHIYIWRAANDLIRAYSEKGVLINSGEFNGLESDEVKGKITKLVGGKLKTTYRLRDWLISRQRYWGAPIPIIYCDKCGESPVPEKDLPVLLPDDVDFIPTGESPLKKSKTFHNVKCPKCKSKARRESDTIDTFVDSSWYFLRFTDSKNFKEFASKKALKDWMPVDMYVGGAEHTVLHLLYARFITKALKRFGHVDFSEPFMSLRHQGLIIAEDGRKMSKSLGNVINPDDIIETYGSDTMRLYEMFMGPFKDAIAWNTKNIIGIRRFIEKVWRLQDYVQEKKGETRDEELDTLLHKTIKKVGDDIIDFKFNTAISTLMVFANSVENKKSIDKETFEQYLKILSPFAPHMCEEIWYKLGKTSSITKQEWPKYDEKKLKDLMQKIVVQVNGKVRGEFEIRADERADIVKEVASNLDSVKKWTDGKKVKNVIYVEGRVVNIVLL